MAGALKRQEDRTGHRGCLFGRLEAWACRSASMLAPTRTQVSDDVAQNEVRRELRESASVSCIGARVPPTMLAVWPLAAMLDDACPHPAHEHAFAHGFNSPEMSSFAIPPCRAQQPQIGLRGASASASACPVCWRRPHGIRSPAGLAACCVPALVDSKQGGLCIGDATRRIREAQILLVEDRPKPEVVGRLVYG